MSTTLLNTPRRMRLWVMDEEPLDHVEAGRGGGREVQKEASVPIQPALYGEPSY